MATPKSIEVIVGNEVRKYSIGDVVDGKIVTRISDGQTIEGSGDILRVWTLYEKGNKIKQFDNCSVIVHYEQISNIT